MRPLRASSEPAPLLARARTHALTHPLPLPFTLPPPKRVGKQVVNIPSFMVRVDSQKHIDFSLTSPFGGGRPGRVKRKHAAAKGGGDAEDDE